MNSGEILAVLSRVKELGYRHFRYEADGIVLEVDVNSQGFAPRALGVPVARSASQTAVASKQEDASWVAIRAPMSGTFFRAPAPNAPPFVEVGSKVSASDTVCIIEVMKLFNSIAAGVDGTVVEIAAANEQAVVTGQPVIWIRPS